MKHLLINLLIGFMLINDIFGQPDHDSYSDINWKNVILRNYATFKSRDDLNFGSAFLIKYNNQIIACTARDFTGTTYTPGKMMFIKDFKDELKLWKMYLPFDPSIFVLTDTLVLKERIEKRWFIFMYSRPFLTFGIKQMDSNIIPLEPSINRTKNKDTVFLIGYDNKNNLNIVRGMIETWDNSK